MKTPRLSAALMTSFVTLLAISATSQNCSAVLVYFDGGPSGLGAAFLDAANWNPDGVPGNNNNLVDIYSIDDGFSSTLSGGSTIVAELRVGSADKTHSSGEIHFGRLTMTGGSLQLIGRGGEAGLIVGRENQFWYPGGGDYNKNTVVDAADYSIWRDTLGSTSNLSADGDRNGTIEPADYEFWKARFGHVVRGGEVIMTGSSTLTANAVIFAERTKALLSIGPNAVVESRVWVTVDEPPIIGPHFSPINTADMRIGAYGPAFDDFGAEPGKDGDGLVDVQGMLNASALYVSSNGGKGELRLSGGTVNLNGALVMSLCEYCVQPDTPANMALLALQSSKVSIIGSKGSFKVGLDPDPVTPDPMLIINAPFSRDISFSYNGGPIGYPTTATFSFTADAGGVTPITVVDNGLDSSGNPNLSGTANIAGTNLVLNLDAYTSASPLTLINAAPGHIPVNTTFGTVTFLGSRTATPVYDYINGDVRLINFQNGAAAGTASLADSAAPEPSSILMMALTFSLLLFSLERERNGRRPVLVYVRI